MGLERYHRLNNQSRPLDNQTANMQSAASALFGVYINGDRAEREDEEEEETPTRSTFSNFIIHKDSFLSERNSLRKKHLFKLMNWSEIDSHIDHEREEFGAGIFWFS